MHNVYGSKTCPHEDCPLIFVAGSSYAPFVIFVVIVMVLLDGIFTN